MIESASPIYNLYRAAQLRFPGEEILEEASRFAFNFLQEKIANDEIQEKWVISEHLIDEVNIAMDPCILIYLFILFFSISHMYISDLSVQSRRKTDKVGTEDAMVRDSAPS